MLRAVRPSVALVIVLLVGTPFVWASTAETWTRGIYDYESDDTLLLIVCDHVAAIPSEASVTFAGVIGIVDRLVLFDRASAVRVVPPACDPRGPPLS